MAAMALQFALNRVFVVTANMGSVFEDVSSSCLLTIVSINCSVKLAQHLVQLLHAVATPYCIVVWLL